MSVFDARDPYAGWAGLGLVDSIGHVAGTAGRFGSELILGSLTAAAMNELATLTGIGSLGHKRNVGFEQNNSIPNAIPDMAQMIQRFNQVPWVNGAPTNAQRRWLQDSLRLHGVDPTVSCWQNLIDVSHATAPLELYLRSYYRQNTYADGRLIVPKGGINDELDRILQRAQLQRNVDKELTLRPPFAFSIAELQRLFWLGYISEEQFLQFSKGAGCVREDDLARVRVLLRRMPDTSTLMSWSVRQLWNEDIAKRYGLDDDRDDSPIAKFFIRGQGIGQQDWPLNGQPEGETDWAKLSYRATRPLPDFHLARILQHRVRSAGTGAGESIIEGVEEWTEDDTRDMLTVHGFTEPIIKRLLAVVFEPLNIRLLNHILMPSYTHPNVKAAVAETFGEGVNWVENAMLDHGFSPSYAKVAATGFIAQAEDRANEEGLAHEKRQRQEKRNRAIADFELGLLSANDAFDLMTDKYFTVDMAITELNLVAKAQKAELAKIQIDAIHAAFMDGTKSQAECSQALTSIGIQDNRRNQLMEGWTWQRVGKLKMLTTKEILTALKDGFLLPAAALVRLTNLGWNRPDAMIEIAQVERSLMLAQARTAAATAAKVAAEAHHAQAAREKQAKELTKEKIKAQHEHEAKLKAEHAAIVKEAARVRKVNRDVLLATHEKLLATAKYYEDVHKSNAAFAAATKKDDVEKMTAELERQVGDYQKYLIEQLQLITKGPEVASVTLPLDINAAAGPQPDSGAGAPLGAGPATPAKP